MGLWTEVTRRNSVFVPKLIISREAYYYPDKSGDHFINLPEQVGKNIQEVSATPEEILQLKNKFNPAYLELHDPETEALVVLSKIPDSQLCTSDEAAVKAAVLLNLINKMTSLETLLRISQLPFNNVEKKDSEQRFRIYIQKAQIMQIQGNGLKV